MTDADVQQLDDDGDDGGVEAPMDTTGIGGAALHTSMRHFKACFLSHSRYGEKTVDSDSEVRVHGSTSAKKTVRYAWPATIRLQGSISFRIKSVEPPGTQGFFSLGYKRPPGRLTMPEKWVDDTHELCHCAAVAAGQVDHVLTELVSRADSAFGEGSAFT